MPEAADPGMVTDAMIEAGYAIMLQPESEAGCDYKTQLGRAYAAMHAARPTVDPRMGDAQIKQMVNRFLMWRLPEDFHPDNGISFKPTFNDWMDPPMRHDPVGTNLLNAEQAEAMVRFMVEGLSTRPTADLGEDGELREKIADEILLDRRARMRSAASRISRRLRMS